MAIPHVEFRGHANDLIAAVLRAADPADAVRRAWPEAASVADGGPLLVLAFGKASVSMARAASELLDGKPATGVVTAVPELIESAAWLPAWRQVNASWHVLPADHPRATERNVTAAREVEGAVRSFAAAHGESGTILALVSGGGSAHLTLPAIGLTLDDVVAVSSALMRAGAPIDELNAVRKHIERLKGGRLAAAAWPCRVEAFIVSDVIGDRLDVISSGPFAPDESTFGQAAEILDRRAASSVCPRIAEYIARGARGELAETMKAGSPVFSRVTHRVIASNRLAVDAVVHWARTSGWSVHPLATMTGEATEAGRNLAREAINIASGDPAVPCVVVMGGEPTVCVGDAPGRGGPSQELALAASIELEAHPAPAGASIGIVTLSTDGIDGPTDAAGAVVMHDAASRMRRAGVDPAAALARHDSHVALDAIAALLKPGPTGTNVNHIAAAIVYPT